MTWCLSLLPAFGRKWDQTNPNIKNAGVLNRATSRAFAGHSRHAQHRQAIYRLIDFFAPTCQEPAVGDLPDELKLQRTSPPSA